ncbi:inositol 1,4,5-trisphosphate receptor-interacting protein-like [Astyanax mexicanus]|uniref:Inositol 1,4,5-trisphosphate receptor-interacting protein n=1 Tax=Astyanax mexicanus TaxID=7994 RepID=A0A8B9GW29_ASTMX|nr:inositol 1,4,5-trisphosphate receptor-interacting protein-like [Astyanax mexicanus]
MVEILRVCVFMVSLLTLKDPTIFEEEEDDDDIIVDIPAQENLLQKEEAILEQEDPGVHSVSEDLLQASQHHQIKWKEEREEIDLQLSAKEEEQKQPVEDQSGLHHESSTENSYYDLETGNTLDKESQQAPHVDNTPSLLDKDPSSGEEIQSVIEHGGKNESNKVLPTGNEIPSQEDAVSVHKKEVQIDYIQALDDNLVSSSSTQNSQKDLDQIKMTDKQKSPEENKENLQKHQKSFFQRAVNGLLRGWFQDSQDKHTESDNESFEGGTQQQLQVTQQTEEMSQTDERLSKVHQRHARTSNEPSNADPSSASQVQGATKRAENTYIWYFLNFLSLVQLIRLLPKFISKILKVSGIRREDSLVLEGKTLSEPVLLNISARMSLLDNKVLSCFHKQCVQTPLCTRERICDFVEGFVNELLEAARNTTKDNKGTDLQIGDPIGVGSLYELWATGKTMVCDLYVPITAPRSYSFEFELDMPSHGKIKMVKAESTSNGCPCANGVEDEDMLCLLHSHNETSKIVDAVGGPLCQENTRYLSRTQVVQWFRKRICKAWQENSHKYEFELAFRNQAAPGALKVRLRSGQVILFNLTPVVQIKGSELYLLTFLPLNQATNFADTHWPVSLASYEKALLKHFNQSLLNDSCHISCLQILSFLHKQQIILTGKCGLKSYHLKMALLHLLLANKPEDWKSDQLACRLTDMLTFLAQRLREGKLHHTLVKNSLVPSDIGLPKDVQSAKPINIFLPLLSDKRLYLRTVEHLQELVKNAPVVIQEYVSRDCSGLSMN